MFGMIILNHMNMLGDNICVKLKLFDKKISELDKIRFVLFDEDKILETIEIDNTCGEEEYSSPFVNFEDLDEYKKYKIVAEYYTENDWIECCNCFATSSKNERDNGVVSNILERELPVLKQINNSIGLPFVTSEVVK